MKSKKPLEELKNLWEQETDKYLMKAATKNIKEYPGEVRAIILDEVNRRGLTYEEPTIEVGIEPTIEVGIERVTDPEVIKDLAYLYGISADSNLLTHLASGLESARLSLKLTKRRTFSVYLYGFLGPLLMIVLLIYVVISNNAQVPPILIVPSILFVPLGIGLFFGARLARKAFYFIPLLNMFCGFLAGGAEGAGSALGSSIVGWILYVVLMRQPHTQAFFANDRYPLPILTVEKLLLRGSSISRSMLAKHHDLKATLGELRDSVDTYVSEGSKPSRRVKQLSDRLQRLLK